MLKQGAFSKKIIDWYRLNKRDLPWRNTQDPYHIWLSEVILQQTRVAQGLKYYYSFVHTYPTIQLLAKAPEQDVLKLWQGLGYYSRARNLHAAAKQVVKEYKGKFPAEYEHILRLKGVGTYTAAAIASFVYNQPHAVVDGNVYRVLARFFGADVPIDSTEGKKYFADLAQQLLDKKNARDHNQAIMEFGAMQCVPVNPACGECVLVNDCLAYRMSQVKQLPVKAKKTKQSLRFFNYLVIEAKDKTYIEKRTGEGIWKNLYQFPLIETGEPVNAALLKKQPAWKKIFGVHRVEMEKESRDFKHVLSHQVIHARFWKIKITGFLPGFVEIHRKDIENYPVPRLIDRFLKE